MTTTPNRPLTKDALKSKCFCSVSSIHGFGELFRSRDDGIKFGSTVLLSGPPGAGKTTFALATVRAMMAGARRWYQSNSAAQEKPEKTIVYYISSEVDESLLRRNFRSFGWFATQDYPSDPLFRFQVESSEPDATNFYAITPMPEVGLYRT